MHGTCNSYLHRAARCPRANDNQPVGRERSSQSTIKALARVGTRRSAVPLSASGGGRRVSFRTRRIRIDGQLTNSGSAGARPIVMLVVDPVRVRSGMATSSPGMVAADRIHSSPPLARAALDHAFGRYGVELSNGAARLISESQSRSSGTSLDKACEASDRRASPASNVYWPLRTLAWSCYRTRWSPTGPWAA